MPLLDEAGNAAWNIVKFNADCSGMTSVRTPTDLWAPGFWSTIRSESSPNSILSSTNHCQRRYTGSRQMMNPFRLSASGLRSLRNRGLIGTLRSANFAIRCMIAVRGKKGLEIGGPSHLFRRGVPVYSVVGLLDNCVFSTETIWEGNRGDGAAYNFLPDKAGHNRVSDAVDLQGVKDSEYDFVLSCHSLEHIANPIKALKTWRRIARGYLVLILPYYRDTFDQFRPVTTLTHMISDFEGNIGEDDLTHLQEVVKLTDLSRVELLKGLTAEEGKAKVMEMSSDNIHYRSMHHHVFDQQNTTELVQYCGYRVITSLVTTGSIFVLAKSV
jgi:hypothetical protein